MDEAPASDEQNRRGGARQRVLLSGKIVQGGGAFSTDCAIRDLSDTGARLRLPAPVPIGEDFYLIEMRNGRFFHAKVMWRAEGEIGVKFIRPDPVEDPASKEQRLLHRLWLDAGTR